MRFASYRNDQPEATRPQHTAISDKTVAASSAPAYNVQASQHTVPSNATNRVQQLAAYNHMNPAYTSVQYTNQRTATRRPYHGNRQHTSTRPVAACSVQLTRVPGK